MLIVYVKSQWPNIPTEHSIFSCMYYVIIYIIQQITQYYKALLHGLGLCGILATTMCFN